MGWRKGADGLSGDKEDLVFEQITCGTVFQNELSSSTEVPRLQDNAGLERRLEFLPSTASAKAGRVHTSAGTWAELYDVTQPCTFQESPTSGGGSQPPSPRPWARLSDAGPTLPSSPPRSGRIIFFLLGHGCPQEVESGEPGP